MKIKIRQESPVDYEAIDRVITAAFAQLEESDQTEPQLVRRLRLSPAFVPELAMVAWMENAIVGHIMLTRISIHHQNGNLVSLALGPLSVLPAFQMRGIGSALILRAHHEAAAMGFQSVIVIGHPDYYPRFGYLPCHQFGIRVPFEAPPEACMAIELIKGALEDIEGDVAYPDVWGV